MRKLLICMLAVMLTYSIPEICKQNQIKLSKQESSDQATEAEKIKSCFAYLIEKQQSESIDSLEESLNDEEQSIMMELLTSQIKRLQSIEQYVIQTKTTCEPVLKWAQNHTHVFVAAKLSHRWDSPPCLKSIQQRYQLINSTLTFINVCLVSNAQIKFYLLSKLYGSCKENLEVKKDGVGTYSLIFQKVQGEIWPYLFQNNEKIQIWYEVMNRNSTLKAQFEKIQKRLDDQASSPPPKSDE